MLAIMEQHHINDPSVLNRLFGDDTTAIEVPFAARRTHGADHQAKAAPLFYQSRVKIKLPEIVR
jgi:hypothetical protein